MTFGRSIAQGRMCNRSKELFEVSLSPSAVHRADLDCPREADLCFLRGIVLMVMYYQNSWHMGFRAIGWRQIGRRPHPFALDASRLRLLGEPSTASCINWQNHNWRSPCVVRQILLLSCRKRSIPTSSPISHAAIQGDDKW